MDGLNAFVLLFVRIGVPKQYLVSSIPFISPRRDRLRGRGAVEAPVPADDARPALQRLQPGAQESPASKRGQDKRFFCRSAAIYHNYDIVMALL